MYYGLFWLFLNDEVNGSEEGGGSKIGGNDDEEEEEEEGKKEARSNHKSGIAMQS